MKRQKHFTIPNALLKKLRGNSLSERLLHRLHAVALVSGGLSASEVGQIYGDSPRAVAYWVTQYRKSGFKGLEEESRAGRPGRLKPVQIKKLQTYVKQSRARSETVNANILSKYIKKEFGISLSTPQCWRILKRLE
jgi:transposase